MAQAAPCQKHLLGLYEQGINLVTCPQKRAEKNWGVNTARPQQNQVEDAMRTRGKGRGIFLILWALTQALLLPGMTPAAMSDGAFLELAGKADAAAIAKALREGANPNAATKYGTTALMRATNVGNAGAVAVLLQAGADVNAQDESGSTALMGGAGWHGNADVVNLLLQFGANVNAKAKDGETALMNAARGADADSIQVLLAAGADVHITALRRIKWI